MGLCDDAVVIELPEKELLAYKSGISTDTDFYKND
jgi:hypothetical protein